MKFFFKIILVFNFISLFAQKEKLILEYKLTYLPSVTKKHGKFKLNKSLSKKIIAIKKTDTLNFELNSSDLDIFNILKREMKFKCSNGSEINFKNNRIILPFNQLSFDELTNSDDLELVVIDGIPFKLNIKNEEVSIAEYRDNLINTSNIKNLKNYYTFLIVIEELNKYKLKPFKYYFNRKVFYRRILNYYDYLNCDNK